MQQGKRGTEVKVQDMKKIMKNRQDAGRKRGGFTLVEIIVVLALMGILLAVSAGGIIGYTTYATYKRNSESAKTIFSAAQSAITYYKSSGKLDKLREDVEGLNHDPLHVPLFERDDTSGARESGALSYLMMSKDEDTYGKIKDAVKAGNTVDETLLGDDKKETVLLFKLLSDYMTDVDLYDASICVEFDALDGVVSGVFYSDKNQAFSYGEKEGAVDIIQRDESYLRKNGVGYYSTELSDRAPTEEVKNLKIKAAKMVNAESLDVQWFLEPKYQYLKSANDYRIELKERENDSSEEHTVAVIELDRSDVIGVPVETGSVAPRVQAKVTLYNSEDEGEKRYLTTEGVSEVDPGDGEDGKIWFHAYLVDDEDYEHGIALSLDVMDGYAGEVLAQEGLSDELLSTYSAYRLSYDDGATHYGLHTDGHYKVSANVSIVGSEGSEKGTDTAENVFFAAGESTHAYEIANARHLYNAGLHEQKEGGSNTYNITQSFAWGGPAGLLSFTGSETPVSSEAGESVADVDSAAQGERTTVKFYYHQKAYAYTNAAEGERTHYPAFPGIEKLNSGSVLCFAAAESGGEEESGEKTEEGEDKGSAIAPQTIDYLTLEPQVKQDGSVGSDGKVGLVRENSGTIQNIKLADVDVRGIVTKKDEAGNTQLIAGTNVGAFSGVNKGTLEAVETVSGYVTGGRNVGGIVGSLGSEITNLTDLKNGAEVSGIESVGGIVGSLGSGAVLSGMENTGIVCGWSAEDGEIPTMGATFSPDPATGRIMPKYIGGIVGYVESAQITDSVSNPAPQADAEGNTAALTADAAQARLYGTYVGGIAGYLSTGATVENCATGTEEDKDSYVLGENFVGGIVGMNAGGTLNSEGEKKSNGATVIGRRFVGGIVGANGMLDLSLGKTESTATHKEIVAFTSSTVLTGWENKGAVMATSQGSDGNTAAYVGGIAGVNAGTIANCKSTVRESGLFEELGGNTADYVGGIAGCNKGSLTSTDGSGAVSGAVGGHDYVGGIVGYNDGTDGTGGTISGYTTDDVAVTGNNFTGGVVGLNTAAVLFGEEELTWQAGSVQGNGYVGGYAGANIIAPEAEVTVKQAGGAASVTANAFAGGLFGYNRIVTKDQLGKFFETSEDMGEEASDNSDMKRMLDAANSFAEGAFEVPTRIIFGQDIADKTAGVDDPTAAMEITRPEAAEGETVTEITAQMFAGGVLGYNAAQTKLTVRDYTGAANVTATGGLLINGDGDETLPLGRKYGAGRTYSFSGGILGYVTENTTLENCSFTGNVTAENATYLGGLAELNEGTINACTASAIGTTAHDYVGGIAGINGYRENGTEAEAAEIQDSAAETVNGRDVVGGVAAENHGRISGTAGAASFTGMVNASGSEAGGVAAINHGTIEGVSETGAVTAAGDAGGIAGRNAGRIINSTSRGSVSLIQAEGAAPVLPGSEPVYIGGIAGENLAKGEIAVGAEDYQGEDGMPKITPAAGSCAGGIAGNNLGTIIGGDYADLESTEPVKVVINMADTDHPATLGGVAGRNEGTIRRINYCGTIDGHGDSIQEAAAYAYGGIAGVNTGDGTIEDCVLGVGKEMSIKTDGHSYVGGIAGRNSGNARISEISEDGTASDSQVTIVTAGAWATGGIAGVNEGKAAVFDALSGEGWTVTSKNKEAAESSPEVKAGPVGGVIGQHTSSGRLYGLENHAKIDGGEAAGGIVGRVAAGSDEQQPAKVVIQTCTNCGSVTASGRAGGIVGEWTSAADGSIGGCDNGVKSEDSPTAKAGGDNGDSAAKITSSVPASAAGIVGGFSGMGEKQNIRLTSCTNFGIIESSLGAGIALIGGTQPGTGGTVTLTDCANAGSIVSGAGIAAYCSNQAGSVSLKLNRCRNYARSMKENEFAGLVANITADAGGNAAFDAGSAALKEKLITIANSIGVADVKYPTVPMMAEGDYKKVSELFGNDEENKSKVYYYSADGTGPRVLENAGTGAAVYYNDGAYQMPGKDAPVELRDLKAINAQTSDETPFDPNAEGFRDDYRGNYNRLELTLAQACMNLQEGKAVDVKNPLNVEGGVVENNGGSLDIKWWNIGEKKPDGSGSDIVEEDGNGVVYRAEVRILIYNDKTQADGDTNGSMTSMRTVPFDGEVRDCSIDVPSHWYNKWARVVVVNYAYNGKASTPWISDPIEILPALASPTLEVRLAAAEEGGEADSALQYKLYLNDAGNYAGCTLQFTVTSEFIGPIENPQTGGTAGGNTEEGTPETEEEGQQTDAAGNTQPGVKSSAYTVNVPVSELPCPLTKEFLENHKAPETSGTTGTGNTPFFTMMNGKIRLNFTDVQMKPSDPLQASAAMNPVAVIATDGSETAPMPVKVEETGAEQRYAPSKKSSFTALLPSGYDLAGAILSAGQEESVKRDGNTVSAALLCKPAMYRAELLEDIAPKDTAQNYLLKDIVIASAQLISDQNSNTLSVSLPVPSEYAGQKAHARVYPLAMSGDDAMNGARFTYCVESGLTLEELTDSEKGYVSTTETATQPGGEETPDSESAEGAGNETETDSETAETTPTVTVEVNKGYSVVLETGGKFSVYYSPFLASGNVNVLDWEEPDSSETAQPAAYGAAGSGAGVKAADEKSSEEVVEDETETETETEEEETEDQTEDDPDQSESGSKNPDGDDDDDNEPDEPALPKPQRPALSSDWESTTGTNKEKNEPNLPLSEAEFLKGITLTPNSAKNTSVFMFAGIYSQRPDPNDPNQEPNDEYLLKGALDATLADYQELMQYQGSWPLLFDDSFNFNLPLSCAGKYLCVWFQAIDKTNPELKSDWSDYYWFRLPRVSLQEPKVTKAETPYVETGEFGIEIYETEASEDSEDPEDLEGSEDPVTVALTENLTHETLTWDQTMYPGTAGYNDAGYKIELYRLLGADETDDGKPTAAVNLMRDTKGYYLELSPDYFTAEERASEEYKDDLCKRISLEQLDREAEWSEKDKADEKLRNLYQIELNQNGLELDPDKDFYAVSFGEDEESDDADGKFPIIQVREYGDLLPNGEAQITRIEYRLVLPDITQDEIKDEAGTAYPEYSLLRGRTAAYCTHSVVISPLLESEYYGDYYKEDNVSTNVEGKECLDIETNCAQHTNWWFYKTGEEMSTDTSTWDRIAYDRVLMPYMRPDMKELIDQINWSDEVKKGTVAEEDLTKVLEGHPLGEYMLLPRVFAEFLYKGTTAEAEAYAYAATSMDTFDLDSLASDSYSFVLGDDGTLELETSDTGSDEIISEEPLQEVSDVPIIENGEIVLEGLGDELIIDEEPQTQSSDSQTVPESVIPEPQTQLPTEGQTQPPTETQTQAPTEPQTQLPVVEVVTEAVEAFTDQADGVMAEGFPEIPADTEMFDGEGY